VRTIRLAVILGALATPALLGILTSAAGLGIRGWLVGLVVGWVATALLAVARLRSEKPAIFPADWITLTRALLSAGVAGLVADSFDRSVSTTALVTLAIIALALDAVDGPVARRTGTATPLGARFDAEVDSFLILLLSIEVYVLYGSWASWVLVIGAARYLLLLGGLVVPWLAAPLPPRYWGKVVAAVQGIALTIAVSGLVNPFVGLIVVGGALALLVESFGRAIVWLFRNGAGPGNSAGSGRGYGAYLSRDCLGGFGRPGSTQPAHAARVRPHPDRGRGGGRPGFAPTVPGATRDGDGSRNPGRLDHHGEGPRHRLLRGARPAVRPSR
jgi:phosphatidylglycerophosphate synthase